MCWAVSALGSERRLNFPQGINFVRVCSYVLGSEAYKVPLLDRRLEPFLSYYANRDAKELPPILDFLATDVIYVRNFQKFVGKAAVEDFLRSSAERLHGTHEILSASVKPNQYFFLGRFVGFNRGVPVDAHFYDFWVLDRSEKVYFRQSWINSDL